MTPLTRLPSRTDLQTALPADLEALVKCGHLVAVTDGVYRRAPRTTPPTTPTPRETHDLHVNVITSAVLHRATAAAIAAHHAARAVLDRVGTGVGTGTCTPHRRRRP